jgi:Holliday junction DNA helicase RuvA
VGPKVALAVLSGIEPAELVGAIRQADLARLTRIPGIGRKTAERLVLELKDRLPAVTASDGAAPAAGHDAARDDVLSALVNLGYQRTAGEQAVDAVLRRVETRAFEPLLREVLRELAR